MRFIRLLVARGDRVADVGANFGVYTRLLAELVGEDGHVTSFEPVPETCDLLRAGIRSLSLRQVSVVQAAVSSEKGEAVMSVPHYDSGGENLYEASIARNGTDGDRKVPVRCVSLGDVFKDREKPLSFLKIDVEGHELAAIMGAIPLLDADRPALMIEVSSSFDEPGSDASKLEEMLSPLGYAILQQEGPALVPKKRGTRAVNYFFLQDEHVRRLAAPNADGRVSS